MVSLFSTEIPPLTLVEPKLDIKIATLKEHSRLPMLFTIILRLCRLYTKSQLYCTRNERKIETRGTIETYIEIFSEQ